MKYFILLCLISNFLPKNLTAQSSFALWKTLAEVQIKTLYNKEAGNEVDYPVFSSSIRALHGKNISIEGYYIPIEENSNNIYFFLSALPFFQCYFCGGAGPETVIEVYPKENIAYTSKAIKIKGVLKINDSDFNRLMYILEEAILVEE